MIKKQYPDLAEKINKLVGTTFSEKCYLYINNITKPLCMHCNIENTKYLDFRRGYTIFCGVKCMANSDYIQKLKSSTVQQKYGVDHFSETNEYKEKFKTTMLLRHGVTNPSYCPNILSDRARKKQRTFWNKLCDIIKDKSIPMHTFDEYTHVRDKELSWKCTSCEVEFTSHIFGVLPECPMCYPRAAPGSQSKTEQDIIFEIRKFYSGEIIENSRKIISPKELDIFIPEFNFAIELNGLYWHSDEKLESQYHRDKYEKCNEQNISLLMITDHEWKNKRELIINMIKHRIHQSEIDKIPAKNTTANLIDYRTASDFLVKHHIASEARGKYYIGLFYKNELIAVTVFGKNRFLKKTSDTEFELIRFAVSKTIAGALGKMISHLKKQTTVTSIDSYADLRYGTGKVYELNNFRLINDTKPGYWYYINNKMSHRLSWTKKKLVQMGFDKSLTESQIMQQLKAIKIYDCGHKLYRIEY